MFCRMLDISNSETISYHSFPYILSCISHAFDQNMYQLFHTRISTSLPPRVKSVFQKQSNVTIFFSLEHLWYIPKIIEIMYIPGFLQHWLSVEAISHCWRSNLVFRSSDYHFHNMSVTKTGLAFFFVIHLSLIIRMPVSRYQIDDKILLLHIVTLVHAFASNNNTSRNFLSFVKRKRIGFECMYYIEYWLLTYPKALFFSFCRLVKIFC